MTTREELKKARKLAEDAVADMPEGELKTKAFEVILNNLLKSFAQEGLASKGAKPFRKRKKTRKKCDQPEKQPSELKLNKDEFSLLKTRVEVLGKTSGLRAFLEIANWLHAEKGIENFWPQDLIHCYNMLRKAKLTNIPPLKHPEQTIRDTKNKCGWFDRNDDGTYEISPVGFDELAKEEERMT